ISDVGITMTGPSAPVAVGTPATFTINVKDNGPSDAGGVSITDNVQTGLGIGTVTPSQGNCSVASQTITCGLCTVPNGQTATITIVASDPTAGTYTNSATVTSTTNDPTSANNSAQAAVVVGGAGSADLALTATTGPGQLATGTNLTYTDTVTNNG